MDNAQETSEQLTYAKVLHWSTIAGFIALIGTFLAYMLGWLPPFVPLHKLPQLWGLSTSEYLKATGTPPGWSWLFRMNKGDFASQLGIAILSGCSIFCIAAIIPAYAREKNLTYIVFCLLEKTVPYIGLSALSR